MIDDALVNYDFSTWLDNINKAIRSNLAFCPSTWLMPSSIVILKTLIPGYNNILKTSTAKMKMGVNKTVNYVGVPEPVPKKVHHDEDPPPYLNTLATVSKPADVTPKVVTPREPQQSTGGGALSGLGVGSAATFLFLRTLL